MTKKLLNLVYFAVPLALSGCNGGDTSSGHNFFAEHCLSPSRQFIDDFCGGCPEGWTPIPATVHFAGACCERLDGDTFWWRGEQCPVNTTEQSSVFPDSDSRAICFLGFCPED